MSQTDELQSPAPATRWLSASEMADRVRVTPRTIQRLARDNRIKHHVVPGTNLIRFSPEDVAAFEAESARVPV